jgi:hypothetical protein
MAKNDLYLILMSFTKTDTVKFRKFLKSPYFSLRSKQVQLYDEIIKYYPLFTHVNLNKRTLSSKIYPRKRYNDATIRNLFSDLHDSALKFLRIENFEKSGIEKDDFLFRELKMRNLNDEFSKIVIKLEASSNEPVDMIFFLNNHFLEANKFNFSHHNKKLKKEKNVQVETSYLNNSINHLIYFFVTTFITVYLNLLSYKMSFKTSLPEQSERKFLELINFATLNKLLKDNKHYFIIELYHLLIKTYLEFDNEEYYWNYKNDLIRKMHLLSPNEKNFHFYRLISYLSFKKFLNPTELSYRRELFVIYKQFLENEYYLDRNTNHLPHDLYRNILTDALDLKEFSWTEEFIKTYSNKVHPKDITNMYNYGYANWHYSLGNYETAIDYINKIEQDYFLYKIDIKNLSLKIYYELNYTEAALSLVKTYKETIRKNTLLNPERKKRYVNFSKYMELLILFKADACRHDIGYIRHKIIKNDSVAFKPWLLEKTESLGRKFVKAV